MLLWFDEKIVMMLTSSSKWYPEFASKAKVIEAKCIVGNNMDFEVLKSVGFLCMGNKGAYIKTRNVNFYKSYWLEFWKVSQTLKNIFTWKICDKKSVNLYFKIFSFENSSILGEFCSQRHKRCRLQSQVKKRLHLKSRKIMRCKTFVLAPVQRCSR